MKSPDIRPQQMAAPRYGLSSARCLARCGGNTLVRIVSRAQARFVLALLLAFAFLGCASSPRDPVQASSLEGEWTSGPDFVAYTLTLTKTRAGYSGHGYNWGCLGRFQSFRVTATESNSLITITRTHPKDGRMGLGERTSVTFARATQNSRPILIEQTDARYQQTLRRTKDLYQP
jgi:hypothetical protein